MAIIPTLPGFKAELIVDGKPLNEYDDVQAPPLPDTTTKYVEAPPGLNFEIQYTLHKPFTLSQNTTVDIRPSLDGMDILLPRTLIASQRNPIDPAEEHADITKSCVCDSAITFKNGKQCVQKFRFANLQKDERTTYSDDIRKQAASLGEVRVCFYYITYSLRVVPESLPAQAVIGWDTVPEKALKGEPIEYQTNLNAPEVISDMTFCEPEYISYEPFATFVFKYRSTEALKTLHLIPRTPEPSPEPEPEQQEEATPPADENMTDEEVRIAYRAMMAQQNGPRGVKREREDSLATIRAADYEDEVEFLSEKPTLRIRRLPQEGEDVLDLEE